MTESAGGVVLGSGGDVLDRLEGIDTASRTAFLRELVSGKVAAALGLADGRSLRADMAFSDLGLSGRRAAGFVEALSAEVGLSLSPTVLFDYPNVLVLAGHLLTMLAGGSDASTTPDDARVPVGEPVAIVGMACRLPGGVSSPEELWQLLTDGVDVISDFPDDRGWVPDGRFEYPRGGFLSGAGDFDPAFFGITPGEALTMDPQQRLALELSWEAVESAGIDPMTLRGSVTGVFIGTASQDYVSYRNMTDGRLTGTTTAVLCGRVSYVLGLTGPAITVDTACSASLVALHLACQALRQSECDAALAGGVQVTATPEISLFFRQTGAGGRDGRCKAFSAAADGVGFSEGAGILLLERLSRARRLGHRVLAVIRGSAVNQDGASNGLTAPNGLSQQQVIRRALASAGLTAGDVDAVEAHGTGTRVGDRIEAQALLATYGQDRPSGQPVWLGSLKSNIGHCLAAAGVAGVIKLVLALKHDMLPKTLHVDVPVSPLDQASGRIEVLTQARTWPPVGRPRRAGVSSFGVGGTNAHMILESADFVDAPKAQGTAGGGGGTPAAGLTPWVVSARSVAALAGQAQRLADFAARHPDLPALEVAWSLVTTRSRFDHRAVLLGRDSDELAAAARALAQGRESPAAIRGDGRPAGKTAWLFTGQGSQRAGMSRDLYAAEPAYAQAFDAVCGGFSGYLERPLRDVVFANPGSADAALLDRTDYTQAALFALEVALSRLLQRYGVRPDLLLGHSVGELVAAHVAGVLSLDEACWVVAERGRLMRALPAGGAMVAVKADLAEVEREVAGHERAVSVAAVNGPAEIVISGAEDAVLAIVGRLASAGHPTRRLSVSHAFHSPLMDPMLADFEHALRNVSWRAPAIPVVSNLSGLVATTGQLCSARYWADHARGTVRFREGLECLAARGVSLCLELGPGGVLSALAPAGMTSIPLLRHGKPEPDSLLTGLAALFAAGAEVDWQAVLSQRAGGTAPATVDLPTYAFDHQRFWAPAETTAAAGGRPPAGAGDLLRYRETWKPVATVTEAQAMTGAWLLVTGSSSARTDPVLPVLASAMSMRGAEVTVVEVGDSELNRESVAARIDAAVSGLGQPVSGVISGVGMGDGDDPRYPGTPAGLAGTTALVQALGDLRLTAPLWCLTREAAVVDGTDRIRWPTQAMIWGFSKVAALEQPDRWGGVVDLPAHVDDAAVRRLLAVICDPGDEDQVALRPSGVYGRRLVRAPLAGRAPVRRWRARGTVLITGGTGGLGAHVARWLASNGAEHLVLISRRGPDAPGAEHLRRELTRSGVAVTVAACDVADRAALADLLDGLNEPPTAVVHTAGIVSETAIEELDHGGLGAVLRAKVTGAANLDELLGDRCLDAFVLFSSISATWGSGRQAGYAAANSFLDGLARSRRERGLTATSIAWGPWAGGGMTDDTEVARVLARRGLRMLDPSPAISAMAQALDHDETCVTIAEVDWDRFATAFTALRPSPLLSQLIPSAGEPAAGDPPASAAGALRRQLAGLDLAGQQALLTDLVRADAATVLGQDSPDTIDPDALFTDIGFDSLAAAELRDRLAKATGLPVSVHLVIDHPTAAGLGRALAASMDNAGADATAGALAAVGPVEALFWKAYEENRFDVALSVVETVSMLRPTFDARAPDEGAPQPVALSRGRDLPVLMLVPTCAVNASVYQYIRFSKHFSNQRESWYLPLPGFSEHELLPKSLDDVIALLERSALDKADGRPIALLGHSSGGWFANELAYHLEQRGMPPLGVVLVDTYPPKSAAWEQFQHIAVAHVLRTWDESATMSEARLTAMGCYQRMFHDWSPRETQSPTLLIHAGTSLADGGSAPPRWRSDWPLPHEAVIGDGDHFTLMEDHASRTGGIVDAWLGRLVG